RADEVHEALILRMNRNARIAQHRLGTRGCDGDVGRRVLGIEGYAFDRIAEVPEVSVDLPLLDLEVRDCGEQLRVPIDQTLVLVDQALLVERDENLDDSLRQTLIHSETLTAPVGRSTKALQLVEDRAAGFGLP